LNNGVGVFSSSEAHLRFAVLFLLSLCVAAAEAQPSVALEPTRPEIVSREAWGAQSPNTELMQEQKPAEIIIHHTGALQQPWVSLEAKLRGMQNFSMNPGKVGLVAKPAWGDILYHYYIDLSGKIAEGRDVSFAGDAATNLDNDDRIQIVLEGDFEREQPPKAQLESLTRLITWLAAVYGIAPANISGHSDHEQTGCPGKNLKVYLEELRKAVRAEFAAGDR
jgi:hypothetical protein